MLLGCCCAHLLVGMGPCMWARHHACGHEAVHVVRMRPCMWARGHACGHEAMRVGTPRPCMSARGHACGHEAMHVGTPRPCMWARDHARGHETRRSGHGRPAGMIPDVPVWFGVGTLNPRGYPTNTAALLLMSRGTAALVPPGTPTLVALTCWPQLLLLGPFCSDPKCLSLALTSGPPGSDFGPFQVRSPAD